MTDLIEVLSWQDERTCHVCHCRTCENHTGIIKGIRRLLWIWDDARWSIIDHHLLVVTGIIFHLLFCVSLCGCFLFIGHRHIVIHSYNRYELILLFLSLRIGHSMTVHLLLPRLWMTGLVCWRISSVRIQAAVWLCTVWPDWAGEWRRTASHHFIMLSQTCS